MCIRDSPQTISKLNLEAHIVANFKSCLGTWLIKGYAYTLWGIGSLAIIFVNLPMCDDGIEHYKSWISNKKREWTNCIFMWHLKCWNAEKDKHLE